MAPPLVAAAEVEGGAQIGQTRHWCPLVAGNTGHYPPHRRLVMRLSQKLPAPWAIQTLVDMTHVNVIVLRPEQQWPSYLRRQRARIAGAPWARRVWSRQGWDVLLVTLQPTPREFFPAIAAGWRPGETALGTPVDSVPRGGIRAVVEGRVTPTMRANAAARLPLTVRNDGATAWAVDVPRFAHAVWPKYEPEVYLLVTWRRQHAEAPSTTIDLMLPRDIRAGESLTFFPVLRTPPPGRYVLEIAVRARNEEATGVSPSSLPLSASVQVQ